MGHVLGDDIFSVFFLMHEFGVHTLPRSQIAVILPAQYREVVEASASVREHFRLLSDNPVAFYDGDTPTAISGQPACFPRLLFGWRYFGYSNLDWLDAVKPTETVVSAFRRHAMQLFGLEDSMDPSARSSCSVLFIVKDQATAAHHFSIANVDELILALRERTACSVERVTWAGMPLQQQVSAIYEKRIVVSLHGSDLMNCIFQPLRSGIIVADFCEENGKCGWRSREVDLWFSRFPTRLLNLIPSNGHLVTWNGQAATWNVERFIEVLLYMNATLG